MSAATEPPLLSDVTVVGDDASSDVVFMTWAVESGESGTPPQQPTVKIRYSPDQGESWTTLDIEVTGNEYSVNKNQLPASENGLLEIMAVDRTLAVTEQFEIGPVRDKHPHAVIVAKGSRSYHMDELILLESLIMDVEDESFTDDQLIWSEAERGELGRGRTLLITDWITPDRYDVTLTVTDSGGNSTEASIEVEIRRDYATIYLPLITR